MERITLLLLVLTPLSSGQKFSFGSCQSTQSYALAAYFAELVAEWRLYAMTPTLYFHNWNCITLTGTAATANEEYNFAISGSDKITGRPLSSTANLKITAAEASGTAAVASNKYIFTFGNALKSGSASYYLLRATTSNEYSVFYSCENYGFGKIEYAMIWTTAAGTVTASINAALAALEAQGYPLHGLRRTYDQASCTV